MEFSGRFFLAAIEEDNTQRALFRVRPLLSEEGGIPPEDIDTLGDEGFLRVVPDRAEQHSFKERMRELGHLCLIDLRSVPAEISKVRNNKNYSPSAGEVNRYVIYSDAIRELSEAEIYEVVAEGRAAQPDTVNYYLRKGGHIQGPFDAGSAEPAAPLSCIAPDNSRLFCVTMPDGREKLYYWPAPLMSVKTADDKPIQGNTEEPEEVAESVKPADEYTEVQASVPSVQTKIADEAPAPQMSAKDKILELQAAISPLLDVKDEEPAAEAPAAEPQPAHKAAKLSGAPIRVSGHKPAVARRDTLSLSSVVDREVRRSGRPQEPSVSLNNSHDLHPVENPAEQFKQALRRLWNGSESRKQALNSFLSMDGAAQALCEQLSDEGAKAMQAVVHQQLNELEAERLALVMELDRLQHNRADMLKEALSLGGRQAEELEHKKQALSEATELMRGQCAMLDEQRAALIKEMKALSSGGCYAAPGFGDECSFEKASKLVAQAFGGAGFAVSKVDASSLLIMAMSFPQVAFEGDDIGDERLAARLLCRALGAAMVECSAGEEPVILTGGDAAVFALYQGSPDVSSKDSAVYSRLIVGDSYALPRVQVRPAPGFMMEMALRTGTCIRKESVCRAIKEAYREIPADALSLLAAAETAFKRRLPLSLKRDVLNYLSPAQTLLEGGIASALDYAFAGFIIPFAKRQGMDMNVLRGLCAAMPLSSSLL